MRAVEKRSRIRAAPAAPSSARSSGRSRSFPEPARERVDVSDRLDVARLAVVDDRASAAGVGRDHRQPGGECLDRDDGRAFVRRGEQEGVERAVPRADVVDVAEDVHAISDAERRCELLDVASQLAVPRDHEHRIRNECRGADEIERALDLRQAAGPADHERGLDAELGALGVAGRRGSADARVEIEAVVDDGDLLGRRHPEAHEVVAHLLADRDDPVGLPGQRALDLPEHALAHRVEVAGEHMPVKRVHDRAGPRRSLRAAPRRDPSSQPSRCACATRRVGVPAAGAAAPGASARRRTETPPVSGSPGEGRERPGRPRRSPSTTRPGGCGRRRRARRGPARAGPAASSSTDSAAPPTLRRAITWTIFIVADGHGSESSRDHACLR